jgi:hypothetical protein
VLVLLVSLVSELILDELTGTVLSLNHIHLALGEGFLVGLSNHHVNVLSFGLIVLFLLHLADLVLLNFLLGVESSVPGLVFSFVFALVDSVGLVFFAHAMLLSLHLLL